MVEGIEETKRIVHHEAIPQGIHYPGNGIGYIDSDLGEGLGRDIWWQGGGDEQVRADQMFQGLKRYFLKNMVYLLGVLVPKRREKRLTV